MWPNDSFIKRCGIELPIIQARWREQRFRTWLLPCQKQEV